MSAWQLLPAVRDLYSRHPEYDHHEHCGAIEVARGDYPQWGSAA